VNRRLGLGVAAVAVAATTSGCSLGDGLYGVTLPGGASLGSHPVTVTIQFANALDLVPQSSVEVNDVPVGRVTSISLAPGDRLADVTVAINGDVRLPANAVASIQQTSLLGEKYVALAPPLSAPPVGRLQDGQVIAVTRTSDGVQVEQVLGALSVVLNEGGIGQIRDIAEELNRAASGRTGELRHLIGSSRRVITQLTAHRSTIITSLRALNTLAATLRADDSEIAQVLNQLTPGIAELAGQRRQIVAMINALDHLQATTEHTVAVTRETTVEDLRLLGPVLDQLIAARSDLPKSLQVLATYPFTPGALRDIKGDYLNGFVTTDLHTKGGRTIHVHDWVAHDHRSSGRQPATIDSPPTLLPSAGADRAAGAVTR